MTAGEAFDATPENIEKRAPSASELPGGIKIATLSKSTPGKAVRARMTLRFGNEAESRARPRRFRSFHSRHAARRNIPTSRFATNWTVSKPA